MSRHEFYKCDRCKYENIQDFPSAAIVTVSNFSEVGLTTRWDLCSACRNDLTKWLQGKD